MSTTVFRVFIADQHIHTNVYNKECWHRNINVEPYRVRRKIHHQNIRIREAEQKAHQTKARTMHRTGLDIVATPMHLERPAEFFPNARPALITPLMKGPIQ